jgi:hypothetical protein
MNVTSAKSGRKEDGKYSNIISAVGNVKGSNSYYVYYYGLHISVNIWSSYPKSFSEFFIGRIFFMVYPFQLRFAVSVQNHNCMIK